MRISRKIIYYTFISSFFTCSSNEGDDITGKWMMHAVYESENDVTKVHNPDGDRWIELKSDGSFKSGGTPYGINTGSYNLDPRTHELFIDSDSGEDDDSRWMVLFKDDQMIWNGLGSERAESFSLIHVRVK